ncbi:MAG: ferredoxin--nitrite reductase [Nitrospinaceae bacterium]|nr:MAG: ferredoxin--nitrite reductase [Nitrospinaceae bacterium]
MNKIERIKLEKDGLDIKKDLHKFAEEGWEAISDEDVQRLKWYGLFLRNPTPGFFMLRVRISNGHTFSYQIKVLAQIAQGFGNGVIDITTRQQLQIRHLKIENIPEVFELLEMTGLTSAQTGMDNVRNIMGCPVAGIHPKEALDASPAVWALTEHILGNREFTNLPRKFNVAITGCPDNCLHAETQDLALVPASREENGKTELGFNVLAGGKLGSGGYRIASCLNVFVTPEEVVEVCSAVILLFRDHGSRENRSQNRLAFLLDEWGVDRFRAELEKRLKRPLKPAEKEMRQGQSSEHIGIYRQKQPSMNYVGLKIPVGRIQGKKLEQLAELAERYGNGEIRISPAQSLILPNVSDKNLGDLLEEPLLKELDYHPSSILRGLVSCVGSDYCHLAAIETKSRALEVASKLEKTLSDTSPITMHWSGCPAGCGNHLVGDIGLLGKRIKYGGEVVDGVDVFVGGRAGPDPKLAVKILENVPCDLLPEVLEKIIPYHTREKMHRVKGQRKRKAVKKKTGEPAFPETRLPIAVS